MPRPPPPPRRARSALLRKAAKAAGARPWCGERPVALALPTLVRSVPLGPSYSHEVKRDGYRACIVVRDGQVTIRSRQNVDFTSRLPSIVADVAELGLHSAQLDGELIAVTPDGRDDFELLQRVLSGRARAPLALVAFDLMQLEDTLLVDVPLVVRKQLLADLVSGCRITNSTALIGAGADAFAAVVEHGYEGLVSKRIDAPYPSGRTRAWVKVMARREETFVVVGWMRRAGPSHGGLMVARRVGDVLHYAGRVGSGITDAERRALRADLRPTTAPSVTLNAHLSARLSRIEWFVPAIAVRVAFREITSAGLLRHPSYKGRVRSR